MKDGRLRFRLDKPCQLSIEPGGSLRHPLHLFANPLEKDVPAPNAPGVRYYGPGFHEVGEIDLVSNETVYIAGGAVVSLKPQAADKLAAGQPASELRRGRLVVHRPLREPREEPM